LRGAVALLFALLAALAGGAPAAAAAIPQPSGAPGTKPDWTPADKHGFGTSTTRASNVWFTLRQAELSEVYYPDLGTPAVRDLELAVGDGHTFVQRETQGTRARVVRLAGRGLAFRQTVADRRGRWRLEKTFVTDPARATVLVDVRLRSLTGRPYRVYVLHDPALSNDGADDRGDTRGSALVARDAEAASAVVARPALTRGTSGYAGRGDPWHRLRAARRLAAPTRASRPGNVRQAAETALRGTGRRTRITLALGFGASPRSALRAARGSLVTGFRAAARAYGAGWRAHLAALEAPASVAAPALREQYEGSLMVLEASEDKTYRGAGIASPSMPWGWGLGTIEKDMPSGPYHLVWARDLYQVGTALLAAGDTAAAGRAVDYLFGRQQKPDGSFPQNSEVDGAERWTNTQLDEVALPIVLAWQLGRTDDRTWAAARRAADYLVRRGPRSRQERWENQSGWSPGTIAAEIAGLVCAADLARRRGDVAAALRYEGTADAWAASVERWTATSTGPFSPRPYYLRVTKGRDPDRGTTYDIGDSGPGAADQRGIVDPSFLELVRLGVKPHDDPVILNTLQVVDATLRVQTPDGPLWHRFTFDGYGERRDGGPWALGKPGTSVTLGRAWPLFSGERGEYELLAGRPAAPYLASMAAAANDGGMLPEQVWDGRPPTGRPGFRAGEGTFSATPLAWTHAQFVRLAWSIDAGRPVEQPAVVACRYAGPCP
jgi:glucoamylase